MTEQRKVFERLRKLLIEHAENLKIVSDTDTEFSLNTGKLDDRGKSVFFGMVKEGKQKVAYHLMPVYCQPELLNDISVSLKKRMQGKSCFNFDREDELLFRELQELTRKGVNSYKEDGKL